LHLSLSFANSLYYLFVAYYCFFSSFSQAIARKIANQISRSSFVYKIIVVYSLVFARTIKINTIVAIIAKTNAIAIIVVAMFVATNEIECLD